VLSRDRSAPLDLPPSLILPVTVRQQHGYLVVREALGSWEDAHGPIHTMPGAA